MAVHLWVVQENNLFCGSWLPDTQLSICFWLTLTDVYLYPDLSTGFELSWPSSAVSGASTDTLNPSSGSHITDDSSASWALANQNNRVGFFFCAYIFEKRFTSLHYFTLKWSRYKEETWRVSSANRRLRFAVTVLRGSFWGYFSSMSWLWASGFCLQH